MKKMNLKQCSMIVPLLGVALALLPVDRAEAGGGSDDDGVVCTVTVPDMGDTTSGSGDLFYSSQNWGWCTDSWMSSNAKAYGMVARKWEGHGWNDACNLSLPTARFFASVVALDVADRNSTDSGLGDDSILKWGWEWTWKALDTLKVDCASSAPVGGGDSLGYTNWNGHVWFFSPNTFYNDAALLTTTLGRMRSVPARASTVIHEVRHKKGKLHCCGGKDQKYNNGGVWTYQAHWLGWYARASTTSPIGLRCQAQSQANLILQDKFKEATSVRYNFRTDPNDDNSPGVCDP